MARAAIILALMASPAYASDVIAWGGTSARIVPADGPHIATVICTNAPTSGHDTMTQGRIDVGGFPVFVRVTHGPGDAPDRFEITAPDGYIAIPAWVDVPEHGTADVLIFSLQGGMS